MQPMFSISKICRMNLGEKLNKTKHVQTNFYSEKYFVANYCNVFKVFQTLFKFMRFPKIKQKARALTHLWKNKKPSSSFLISNVRILEILLDKIFSVKTPFRLFSPHSFPIFQSVSVSHKFGYIILILSFFFYIMSYPFKQKIFLLEIASAQNH